MGIIAVMDRPNYEKLNIWQDGMELVKSIYLLTRDFPKDELFGLTSQIRRAAVSVPANISEGHGRGSKKEFRQFLAISKGSLQELNTLLEIAKSLHYMNENEYEGLRTRILSLVKRITSLIRNLVPQT